jgi:hypothetical protein
MAEGIDHPGSELRRFRDRLRRSPHPKAFNRTIAATSSGVRIQSPRNSSYREETSADSLITCTSSHDEVVQFCLSPPMQFSMSPDSPEGRSST